MPNFPSIPNEHPIFQKDRLKKCVMRYYIEVQKLMEQRLALMWHVNFRSPYFSVSDLYATSTLPTQCEKAENQSKQVADEENQAYRKLKKRFFLFDQCQIKAQNVLNTVADPLWYHLIVKSERTDTPGLQQNLQLVLSRFLLAKHLVCL